MKELVSFLAERKIILDPTLTVDELSSLALYEEQAKDPNNRFLPRDFIDEAETAPEVFRLPPELKEAAAAGFREEAAVHRTCAAAQGYRSSPGRMAWEPGRCFPASASITSSNCWRKQG